LNKADVTEEIDRLKVHLGEMRLALGKSEPVGRRLDFLCQEFHREVNTLCSKPQDGEVSRLGVEMKVLVEKLREQAQNIQ
ncbi:endoribonuclease YicC domain-containing protein, partial [Magnetococcales bacterium HHB-1]